MPTLHIKVLNNVYVHIFSHFKLLNEYSRLFLGNHAADHE